MMTVPPYNDRHEGMMYAKLYATILRSSIWLENDETRLLWIAMLAAADEKGYVFGSPAGMAHTARISVDAAKAALLKLSSPDQDSSDLSENPENEGRRIEVVDGGWRLINYARYRAIRDSEERREQNRQAKQRQRERASAKISHDQPASAKISPSESELESESKKKSTRERAPFVPPSVEEVEAYAKEKGLAVNAAYFVDFFEAKGWMTGKVHMRAWRAAARNAARDGWTTRQGVASPPPTQNPEAISSDRQAEVARELAEERRMRKEKGL